MKKFLSCIIVIGFCSTLLGACTEFKSAGRTIGHATKDAATDIGHGTRRVVKEATK